MGSPGIPDEPYGSPDRCDCHGPREFHKGRDPDRDEVLLFCSRCNRPVRAT